MIKYRASEKGLQPINLPMNIKTVFSQLPVDVNISYVVDGQPATPEQGESDVLCRLPLNSVNSVNSALEASLAPCQA